MCKFVIPLPSFVTLLSTEEDPYVNVDVILSYFRLVRREAEVKTTRLRFKPSSLAVCAFKYIPLKIRSINESRRLSWKPTFGCKKKNQTVNELSRTVLLK